MEEMRQFYDNLLFLFLIWCTLIEVYVLCLQCYPGVIHGMMCYDLACYRLSENDRSGNSDLLNTAGFFS